MNRIERLCAEMRQTGLEALVLVPGVNLHYLAGLELHMSERLSLLILTADGRAAAVLPRLEQPRAEAQARMPIQFFPWADTEGPQQALAHGVASLELEGRVGVEYTAMRVLELRALEAVAPQLSFEDGNQVIAALRMSKDAEELAAMRQAIGIIESSLTAALANVRVDMTELEFAAILDQEIYARNSSPSFTTIVASGPNSANPHHSNSTRGFQPGDLVIVDCGAWYQGYASDLTRTFAIGEPTAEVRQIYQLVQQANAAGRQAAAQAGASGASIDAAARSVIEAGGYGPHFIHRTGHGLGLEIHEPPYIVAGATTPLPVGATFTVEPGIYVAGLCGVRIEDNVVITADGAETLTTFPRDLQILTTTNHD